jgi:hypothetical protein
MAWKRLLIVIYILNEVRKMAVNIPNNAGEETTVIISNGSHKLNKIIAGSG